MKAKEKMCGLCYGMSWRVEGKRCIRCGTLPDVELITAETCGVSIYNSSAAREDITIAGMKQYFTAKMRGTNKGQKGGT